MIQSGTLTVGLMEGLNTASSYFLMVIPDFQGQKDKPFIFADCAVNIDPNAEELAAELGTGRARRGMLEGDLIEGELEIGQVSGLITDIPPVSEIMDRLLTDYESTVRKLHSTN